ncbi:MAG TPA: ABC transporter permease [Jatrophihabitantaceae bacterium]|nr:ABC transporter permease [Jatrophihabitantaceae bacterium]
MNEFLAFAITGLFTGAAYAIAASGLVLTYATTRVFNLGHGAIGMFMSFVYWQLTVADHWPVVPAILLILFVLAPALGIALERVVMRGLGNAPVSVSLVVTIGLFIMLVGLAIQFWPTDRGRAPVRYFFRNKGFIVGNLVVTYHQVLTIGLSVVVAGGLYILLNRTRTGTAMRAVVDNQDLVELFGASASRLSMLSWAIGSSLASLAGILLVSYVGLDYYQLTFLVINAFAAAMLGRLRSLPLTFVGAIVLGLGQSFAVGYLPTTPSFFGFQSSLPTFLLFLIVIFVPQVQLRVGQIKGILAAPVPTLLRTFESGVGVLIALIAILPLLTAVNVQRTGLAIAWAIVMLSLMLLTGYGGYVSLAQLSFMGLGAAVVAKMDTTSPLAVLLAVLVCAAVGALVALPVLRLTGLYLALATLAFAQLMDKLVFQANFLFGFNGSLNAKRMTLFGLHFTSDRSFVTLMGVVFVLLGMGLLALRRGSVGRLLIAMRDSPAACGTLGLNQRWFRVALFAASAGIAGLAGALYAGLRETVSQTDFVAFEGLLILALAVIAGVTSVTGAAIGGALFMLLPVLPGTFGKAIAGIEYLVIGVGAVSLGRDPNGIANYLFKWTRWVWSRIPLFESRDASGGSKAVEPLREPAYDADFESEVASHGVA